MIWYEPADCTTPRGWLRYELHEHPDFEPGRTLHNYAVSEYCLSTGNYLTYQTCHGPNGETVHACSYSIRLGPSGSYSISRGSKWCHTVEEAKTWINASVNATAAQLALL